MEVVCVAFVGVVIVVAIIGVVVVGGGVSLIIKLSFVDHWFLAQIGVSRCLVTHVFGHKDCLNLGIYLILLNSVPSDPIAHLFNGWAYAFHQDQRLISQGTGVPVGPVFLLGLLVLAIVAACASRAAGTLSVTKPTDEDGNIGMGDSIGVSVSLGGGISSGGNKSQESNIGDSDNTEDGGKTARGRIVRLCGGLMASYCR
ncbi:hypothetical protein Tco_0936050 [Tanacetum coccineum]